MKEYDPRKQFSKWLARWSAIFWFAYLIMMGVVLVIQPAAADAALYLGVTASVVMIVNVWAYTRNSIYEKAFRAGVKEIGKMRISWKNAGSETEAEDSEEGGDNG